MHAPSIAVALTDAAFDVGAVAARPELRGLADDERLTYATAELRALVTEDVTDFLPLAARWAGEGKVHAGLVFTHPARFNRAMLAYPGNVIAGLREFLDDPPIGGESWIWWL